MFPKLTEAVRAINLEDPDVQKLIAELQLKEVSAGEEPIQLDEETVKLMVYTLQLRKQLHELKRARWEMHQPGAEHNDETCRANMQQLEILGSRMRHINPLFWSQVRLEHDLTEVESLELRTGWQVVKTKPEDNPEREHHLIELVGGDGFPFDELLGALRGISGQPARPQRRWPFGRN